MQLIFAGVWASSCCCSSSLSLQQYALQPCRGNGDMDFRFTCGEIEMLLAHQYEDMQEAHALLAWQAPRS